MKDEALAKRCRGLRVVLSAVGGVLTDGALTLLPDGRELKSFNVRDGMAVVLAQRVGLRVGLVSGRRSQAVTRRAADLGITIVEQGVSDKRGVLGQLLQRESLDPRQVAYIGDDVNDLPAMRHVGLSAAPADAPLEVRGLAFMVTETFGVPLC